MSDISQAAQWRIEFMSFRWIRLHISHHMSSFFVVLVCQISVTPPSYLAYPRLSPSFCSFLHVFSWSIVPFSLYNFLCLPLRFSTLKFELARQFCVHSLITQNRSKNTVSSSTVFFSEGGVRRMSPTQYVLDNADNHEVSPIAKVTYWLCVTISSRNHAILYMNINEIHSCDKPITIRCVIAHLDLPAMLMHTIEVWHKKHSETHFTRKWYKNVYAVQWLNVDAYRVRAKSSVMQQPGHKIIATDKI